MQFKETKNNEVFEINFQVIGETFISEDTYWLKDTEENRKFVELILNDFPDMERDEANAIIEHAFMLEFTEDHHFGFRDVLYYDKDGKVWMVEKDEV